MGKLIAGKIKLNKSKIILFIIVTVVIGIQFFQPDKNEGDISATRYFFEDTNPSEEVKQILKTSCFDCHTNETRYPWYGNITPINYWMNNHINEGKGKFNFGFWEDLKVNHRSHKLEELIDLINHKEMPLRSYSLMHSGANLTDEQIDKIVNWANNVREDYTQRTQHAMSIVFRETPYSNIKGANYISKDSITNVKHFEFDYDAQGRLIESRYVLNDELIAFNDRFVRAPKIKISYQGNLEIRTFYNEYGHRTLVSGDVYETKITLNEKGERIALTFYGLNGKPIENDFGIATYHWEAQLNGSVIESRYNLKGELVRNRPEFQYMITKFVFDQDNMLTAMTNLGLSGKKPTPDDSGVVTAKIKYDNKGRFIEWANFDMDGSPIKGMTNLAKIVYEPSAYFSEEVAIFIDENNKPQNSNWGVHKIIYKFDSNGNEIERTLRNTLNQPTNSRSGLGLLKSTYTENGKYKKSSAYFDKDEKPIGFGENQVHELRVEFDNQNRPIRSSFYDLSGKIANGWSGYATEEVIFDEQGRLTVRQYLDNNGNLVNNQDFDIARFVYEYKNDVELQSVKTYDAEGNEINPQWNPNH